VYIDDGISGADRRVLLPENRERTRDSSTDKIVMSLTGFADEFERKKARQRTHDTMIGKARAEHVTAGRVFGCDRRRGSTRPRLRFVRQIFKLCAEGAGLTRITKTLNARSSRTGAGCGAGTSTEDRAVLWAAPVHAGGRRPAPRLRIRGRDRARPAAVRSNRGANSYGIAVRVYNPPRLP
jgi:hypothetical protein